MSQVPCQPSASSDRDRDLIRAARSGESWAALELAERFRLLPRVLRWLNRQRNSPLGEQDLEDLAQDIAIKILGRLEQIEPRGTLDAWLCQFTQFEFLNRLRVESRRRRRVGISENPPEQVGEAEEEPRIDPDVLLQALAMLPEEQGEVVRLRHFDGLTFEAVGEKLQMSPNTIKSRYYKAILRLRTQLKRSGA